MSRLDTVKQWSPIVVRWAAASGLVTLPARPKRIRLKKYSRAANSHRVRLLGGDAYRGRQREWQRKWRIKNLAVRRAYEAAWKRQKRARLSYRRNWMRRYRAGLPTRLEFWRKAA